MPFNSETSKAADQKSRCGPSKLFDPNVKEKMEILYEGVLDHLIMHQQDLSMSDTVKLLQSLSNYLLPKTKPVRDVITLEKLEERNNLGIMERGPDLQSSRYFHKSICISVLISLCSNIA